MKINVEKKNYMVFSRAKTDFGTRLNINNVKLDNVQEAKIVGVWLSPGLKWAKNTKELTIKAFSRLGMITKLKYVGVAAEDLYGYLCAVHKGCTGVLCSCVTLWSHTAPNK